MPWKSSFFNRVPSSAMEVVLESASLLEKQQKPGLGYGSKVAKIDNQKLEACENPVLRETQVVWLFFWGGKENC